MNLGFYVDTNGGTPRNIEIYNLLNDAIKSGQVSDASLFFNTVNFNPLRTNFGMFDATELWSFTGKLVATSLDNALKARSIVNKFELFYLFESSHKKEQDIFKLVNVAKTVPTIVTSEADQKEFYRLTGVIPALVSDFTLESLEWTFNLQKEQSNE